ncbi:hypothetical protein [Bradyrhizobium iriomotense]|uniref:hypothetical protein n=1 Tax=Bradyrhizobium iriomotense TaxID=441950 RepID=UPI001B8A00B9|nr:hypothetical protein [Bradyrhizobium iriomotense]MBR0783822.1 hypothetical protein [Bradyrhizobium iriomotense]
MKSRTLGALLIGGLIAATAVLARPVAASPGGESSADSIRFGWSRTSGSDNYVDQTWWAVRGHDTPDNFVDRLLSIPVGAIARGASASFEAKLSDDTGLPLPEGWALTTAKNSPLIRSVYAETPRDFATVLGFYRTELSERGWTENDNAVLEPDRAVIAFTTAHGPALLRLSRQDDRTITELSQRKRAVATAGLQPKPGQVRLMLGNKTDDNAVITVAEQTIKLAAHAGEKLANSDSAAGELPDSQKIDLPPGRYKITLKVDGSAAESREFEVAANETWGLLAGTDGVLLPMRLY